MMNDRISDKLKVLKPSGIRKFFDIVATKKDVISLGVGEPDFATPWNIVDAAFYNMKMGRTHYSSNFGLLEFRKEVGEYLKKYDLDYGPDEIIATIGGSEGIDLALRSIINPGDEIIVPEPVYVPYRPLSELTGATVVGIDTSKTEFKVDAKELEKNMNNDFKLSSEKAIKEITDLIDRAIENELYSKIDEMARIAIAYAEAIADGNIPSNAKTISIRNYSKINLNEEVILELENSINVEQVLSEMQNYMKSIFEDYRNNYLDVKIDLKNSFVDYEREISKIFKKVKDRLNSELQEALDIDIQNIDMQTVDIDSTLSFDISIPDSVLDYNHEEYSQTVTKTRTVERSIFNPFRWFGDKYTTEEYEDEEHISRHTLTINPIDLKESIENSMKEITENFSEKEKENYKNAIIELRRKNSDIFQDFRHNKQKEINKLQDDIKDSENLSKVLLKIASLSKEERNKIQIKFIEEQKDTEIKLLLKNALSDEINSPDVFMKGIDASYYYEGYTLYITKELEENK